MRPPPTPALIVSFAVLVGACGASARPQGTESNESPRRFSDNWGDGPGCTPKGEELALEGTILVRPFGKGADGAVLKTNTDEWVVSYRPTGALLEMRGKRVVARGRACDKEGQSVVGKHFDLRTLTPVASTSSAQ